MTLLVEPAPRLEALPDRRWAGSIHRPCDESCAPAPVLQVSAGRRCWRRVATAAAVLTGTSLVVAATALPVPGRLARGLWARKSACRLVLAALGVRLTVQGNLPPGPSLVVGNHISFLDLLVLGARLDARMVAKDEVARWPLIGTVARRTGVLFLQRRSLRQLPEAVAEMTGVLRSGFRVQVFPEATTRCGTAVESFRRAAFQAAVDAGVVVTPFALSYWDVSGPSRAVAFVGEESLLRCLGRVIRSAGVVASLEWLRPIPAVAVPEPSRRGAARKRAAARAERAVAKALSVPVLD